MLLSWPNFNLMVSILTAALGVGWGVYDGRKLIRVLKRPPPADIHQRLARRDLIFGSAVGLALAVIGSLGVVKFYLF